MLVPMAVSPSTKEYQRGTCSKTRINCTFECWDRNNHERMLHTLEVDEVGVDESSVKNILKNWSVDCQKFFFNLCSFWTQICWFIWTKKKIKITQMHSLQHTPEHRRASSGNQSNRWYPVQNCLVSPWGWGMLRRSVFLTSWFRPLY